MYGLSFGNDSATFGDGAVYYRGAHFAISAFWLLAGGVAQVVFVLLEMIRQEKQRLDQKRLKEALASGALRLIENKEAEEAEEEGVKEEETDEERGAVKEDEGGNGNDDPERLLMSPEWRVAILIGGLFGLAPNLCYCYVLALSFLSTPTETGALKPEIDAAIIRGFRLASIAKLGEEAYLF